MKPKTELRPLALPDRPRLRSGCDWYECAPGLLLRSVRGAVCLEGPHFRQLLELLPRLTGVSSVAELLAGWTPASAFYALRALDLLVQLGVLAEGPAIAAELPSPAFEQSDGLQDRRICLLHGGRLGQALARQASAAGARVTHGTLEHARASTAVAIACPDGPELKDLDRINAACRRESTPWFCVLPFGDGVFTGPRMGFWGRRAGGGTPALPCFRCLELRWLGRSPAVAWESAYWAALREGTLTGRSLESNESAEWVAALVLPLVATRLSGAAGSERVALTRFDPLETTQSRLLAHPECEVCAARRHSAARDFTLPDWFEPPQPLAELALTLEAIAEPPCGLASVVGALESEAGSPLCVLLARYAFPDPLSVGERQSNWCHGSAADERDARALALVEALERYAGLAPPAPGTQACQARLGDAALLPTTLPLFSASQYATPGFPFQPFRPDQELRWNWGYDLTRRRGIWVPTSAVWYGYDDSLLGECSSGVAAHSSRGCALFNGALELIERDAFMLHWLHRIAPPRVPLERLASALGRSLARAVESAGYSVHLLDLTTDLGVPVLLAIGFREDGRKPALRVGAGAAFESDRAADKALKELYAATLSATPRWQLPPALAASDVRRLEDHARAYEHPAWLEHAAFLWSSRVRSEGQPALHATDAPHQLRTLLERLAACGHELIGVDMTGADVAAQGVHVVRALIPGLQPLAFGPGPRLGGQRWREAPLRMGARDTLARESELNLVPHCFP